MAPSTPKSRSLSPVPPAGKCQAGGADDTVLLDHTCGLSVRSRNVLARLMGGYCVPKKALSRLTFDELKTYPRCGELTANQIVAWARTHDLERQPNEETHVRVRIAVAVDSKGQWNSAGYSDSEDCDLSLMAVEPLELGERVTFVEAWVPRPVVTVTETIEAEAERDCADAGGAAS